MGVVPRPHASSGYVCAQDDPQVLRIAFPPSASRAGISLRKMFADVWKSWPRRQNAKFAFNKTRMRRTRQRSSGEDNKSLKVSGISREAKKGLAPVQPRLPLIKDFRFKFVPALSLSGVFHKRLGKVIIYIIYKIQFIK